MNSGALRRLLVPLAGQAPLAKSTRLRRPVRMRASRRPVPLTPCEHRPPDRFQLRMVNRANRDDAVEVVRRPALSYRDQVMSVKGAAAAAAEEPAYDAAMTVARDSSLRDRAPQGRGVVERLAHAGVTPAIMPQLPDSKTRIRWRLPAGSAFNRRDRALRATSSRQRRRRSHRRSPAPGPGRSRGTRPGRRGPCVPCGRTRRLGRRASPGRTRASGRSRS